MGKMYSNGEIVCDKENTLDMGSSLNIHTHGKAEIFYFKTLTFSHKGKSVLNVHHWESVIILLHTLRLSISYQLPSECHSQTLR